LSHALGSTYQIDMFFNTTTIYEHERGLRFKNGKFVQVLEPGRHTSFGYSERVMRFDMREKIHPVGGQESLTKDGATIRISMIAMSKIIDPYLFYQSNSVDMQFRTTVGTEVQTFLHYQIQVSLREWVAGRTLDEAMSQKLELCDAILPEIQEVGQAHGFEVTQLQLLDFAIAGSLKSAFSDLLKAEMEGKAAMQRARNEASTLRSLIKSRG
jgi:regulator of protease activity HflC (stomatin/prohibitin superfamily)